MPSTSKITRLADAHIHIFADGFPGKYGKLFPAGGELRTYEAIRAVHNIERALIVGYEGDDWAAGHNAYIAKLARKHKWMAPVAFLFPKEAPTSRQLKSLWKSGFYGISLYINDTADAEALLGWPDEAFAEFNEKQAILSLNADLAQIARLRPFFEKLSNATVLLSHLGLPPAMGPRTTETSARKLLAPVLAQADLPQVGVKLSGFYAVSAYPHVGIEPVVTALKTAYGPKRLYWASDFSPALDDVSFTQTISVASDLITSAAQAKTIFADNLIRVIDNVR